jgi:hypothetical protein
MLGGVPPSSFHFPEEGKCSLAWPERKAGNPPVSLFERASCPQLIFPTTMTSADFSGAFVRRQLKLPRDDN